MVNDKDKDLKKEKEKLEKDKRSAEKAEKAAMAVKLLASSEDISYPTFTSTSSKPDGDLARGGGSESPEEIRTPTLPKDRYAGVPRDPSEDRYWGARGGLQFGYDERDHRYLSPPRGGEYQPQPYAYPTFVPSPWGGWQGPPQGPCPQVPYYGPQFMGPPRGRGEEDSASVLSSAPSGEEMEQEEEGSASDPIRTEEDPTDDLKYEFEETPLTVVHKKVASVMSQAMQESSTRNYQELLQKCCGFTFPANVKATIPQLDHKVRLAISAQAKHNDETFVSIEKMVLAILAPIARACEASLSLSGLSQEQLLQRLAVVRESTAAAVSALSASTGEITRKRRVAIRESAKTVIDMTGIDWTAASSHQKMLFGEDLIKQMTFTKKGKKIVDDVFKNMGLSKGVIDTMAAARKKQSNDQYANYIERYDVWAREQGIQHPFNCAVFIPLNFLQFMMDEPFDEKDPTRRRSFSIMRVITSALSTVLFFDGVSFGCHKLVSQFMKGLLRLRPIQHRYKTQWDMGLVLDQLRNKPWIEAASLSLDALGKKTMFLYLLATANRNHCVTELRISEDRFRDYGNKLEFLFLDEEVKRKGLDPVVKLRGYMQNRQIDPVWYINVYIHRTQKVRGDESKLFISAFKPHKAISTSTARRWVKEVLKSCGVDINRFGPGSTRGAAASAGSAQGASLKEILTAGGWRRAHTFQEWYKRPIEPELKCLSEYTFKS